MFSRFPSRNTYLSIRLMIAPWLSRNPSEAGQLGNPEAPIVARWLRGGTVVAGGAINSRSNRGIEAMVIIDGGIESWWWRRPHNCGSPGPNQLTLGHSHFALLSVIQIGRQLLLKLLFSIIFWCIIIRILRSEGPINFYCVDPIQTHPHLHLFFFSGSLRFIC